VEGPATFSAGKARWRFVAADLGSPARPARLWVLEPERRLARRLADLRGRLALVTLIAVGVGAAAGFALGRFAGRPLSRLREQAQGIDIPSPGGSRLSTTSGVSDIDELARILNELLDRRDTAVARTGEALETARAFAATAAHELRTPLTSMGTNLSLLDHPGLDPAERLEITADLAAEHGRMQRLITMLRRLARGELLDPAEAASDVDLTEMVATAVEESQRRHPHAMISTTLDEDVAVRGWAEGLRMIVDNLLDNAAIHGVDDRGKASITVALTRAGDLAVLRVQDDGPGIPPEDRDRVFVRFQRRAAGPGSGLGLTLVRQQAERQGGAVAVLDPAEGTGARIEVRLPVGGRMDGSSPGGPSWMAAASP
jgi:two-component system sensor histidine kinase PrrB